VAVRSGLSCLRLRTSGEFPLKRYCNFGFYKILGNCRVACHLVACVVVLSSTSSLYYTHSCQPSAFGFIRVFSAAWFCYHELRLVRNLRCMVLLPHAPFNKESVVPRSANMSPV
jgi:hypothetical protein